MARQRARFYVQVRFPGETAWRNYDWYMSLTSALNLADRLVGTKDSNDYRMFPNVRLRYRGFTLAIWNIHGRAR